MALRKAPNSSPKAAFMYSRKVAMYSVCGWEGLTQRRCSMPDSLAGMSPTSDPGTAAGDAVAAVVLAAGAGTRLRPLTDLRPKPLCPVGSRPLLDWALGRLDGLVPGSLATLDPDGPAAVAVNVHHGAGAVVDHLQRRLVGLVDDRGVVEAMAVDGRGRRRVAGGGGARPPRPVVVSWEQPRALGTAGALARLRPWLDGRSALVVNADAWTDVPLAPLLEGWDGVRPRVLVAGDAAFGPTASLAGALVPWSVVEGLAVEPSGLWEVCWREAWSEGSLEVVGGSGRFVDCGTAGDYLDANLAALGEEGARGRAPVTLGEVAGCWVGPGAVVTGRAERSVIGAGALVEGEVVESVVWPGGRVAATERLERAVRAPAPHADVTVLVR